MGLLLSESRGSSGAATQQHFGLRAHRFAQVICYARLRLIGMICSTLCWSGLCSTLCWSGVICSTLCWRGLFDGSHRCVCALQLWAFARISFRSRRGTTGMHGAFALFRLNNTDEYVHSKPCIRTLLCCVLHSIYCFCFARVYRS